MTSDVLLSIAAVVGLALLVGVAHLALRELIDLAWTAIKFLVSGAIRLLWWALIGWWWRRWVAPLIF